MNRYDSALVKFMLRDLSILAVKKKNYIMLIFVRMPTLMKEKNLAVHYIYFKRFKLQGKGSK